MTTVGKEKAILAFLAGGASTAATTLALWAMSLTGAIPNPGAETIAAAVTGLMASVFAALGAYYGTNSSTPATAEPAVLRTPFTDPSPLRDDRGNAVADRLARAGDLAKPA